MQKCDICQLKIASQNSFKTCIGQPPVPISELIIQCTGISVHFDNGLCSQCFRKLDRYYKATQVVYQIKKDLLDLLHSNKELKLKGDNYERITEQVLPEKTEEVFVKEEYQVDLVKSEDNLPDDGAAAAFELNTIDDTVLGTDAGEPLFMKYLVDTELKNFECENASDVDCEEAKRKTVECGSATDKKDAAAKVKRTKKSAGLSCFECEISFPTRRKRQSHMKLKHSGVYICEQCGSSLGCLSAFITHRKSHEAHKKFACTECGQRFRSNHLLRLHSAWHTGDKPYECEICHKRFVHNRALYRHKNMHDEGARRKECNVCGSKFRSTSHLQRHMRTHTGAKPHECPICGKCFSQRYNMKRHLQEHEQPGSTRQPRLKCKKCTRTFVNKENYENHCRRGDCDKQL